MANYVAHIDGMQDAAASIRQIYNSLISSLQSLDGAKNNFTAANQGAAIEGYDAAQREWNAALTDFNNALTVAERSLLTISDGYQSNDQRGAQLFAS
jgi:WXG100 family type VII secretion target